MTKIERARLSEILPSSLLSDEKIKALAHALDTEIMALTAATREVLHLPRLDELSGPILDLLAEQFHVDFYEPLYLDDEIKKKLIRESIAWHRLKGTRWAIEQVNAIFDRKIKLEEWYEYGGEPYWFRVRTGFFKGSQEMNAWAKRLNDAKNVRSWCQIILEEQGELTAHAGMGLYVKKRKRMKPFIEHAGLGLYVKKRKRMKPFIEHAGLGLYVKKRKKIKTAGDWTITPGMITIVESYRTLIITADKVIIRYGEEESENLFGDQLRMTFTFPKSERVIHYKNPREDLTAAEVQAVADFAVENEIFLDRNEDTAQDLHRAVIVSTEEQILF